MSFRTENKFILSKKKIFEFKQWLDQNNYSIIEINEKYSKIWPNITEAKAPMPDHEQWKRKRHHPIRASSY